MTEIKIEAHIGVCCEFMGEDRKKREVSVAIAPIKMEMPSKDRMKIVTGCNMWKSCNNELCYYSMAARKKNKQ